NSLGKSTEQLLSSFIWQEEDEGPFMILCPLSHLDSSASFLGFKIVPFLSCVTYAGDKEERAHLQQDLKQESHFHVLLTTYEICLKNAPFLKSFTWSILVVDEAHRLKNQSSLLHKTLSKVNSKDMVFSLLLTGTPFQNRLQEFYSLLSFVEPDLFSKEQMEDFPFLLRRVKAEVATELPKKTEIVIYHNTLTLQKIYYKAILMKDLDAFGNEMAKKFKLQNILSQLQKCVDHLYLMVRYCVEPEPFEVKDHLIEATGKLHLLDNLLDFLFGLESVRCSP
uniref:Helicase ATP-binding domain-containing protein n=1 Tax=Sciurus vulgaris TaxID=55149 RepID=A0A8D2D544_SCIVU